MEMEEGKDVLDLDKRSVSFDDLWPREFKMAWPAIQHMLPRLTGVGLVACGPFQQDVITLKSVSHRISIHWPTKGHMGRMEIDDYVSLTWLNSMEFLPALEKVASVLGQGIAQKPGELAFDWKSLSWVS